MQGAHVSIQRTLEKTMKNNSNMDVVQVFMGNKLRYKVRDIQNTDKVATKKYCLENGKILAVHTPLVCNFANTVNQEIVDNSVGAVQKILDETKDIPSSAVLHIGANGTMEKVGEETNRLNIPISVGNAGPALLFENSAGEGTKLGSKMEHLRRLHEVLDNGNKIGYCIDTAHLFGAGEYHMQTVSSVMSLFEDLEAISGRQVGLFHFNGSQVNFGSHVDRHSPLGVDSDHIWGHPGDKDVQEALSYFLHRMKDDKIPFVCETRDVCGDMCTVRDIYGRGRIWEVRKKRPVKFLIMN